jgi:ATP-dependent protease ClpP protease subunit
MFGTRDRKWYALSQTTDGETELSIYDEIGGFGVRAKDFISDLRELKGQHVHLRINSPGGSVTDGTAIFNALRRHEGGLTVHVDALGASMASVLAMAGAPTLIADNAMLMIHNPWTVSMGGSDELRRTADILDKLKASIRRAYTGKTGLNEDEVQTLMDDETWLDATEAVALGFADAIEEGVAAAASATPAALRARFDNWAKASMSTPAAPESTVETAPVEPVEAPAADPAPVADPVEAPAADPVTEPVAFADLSPVVAQLRTDLSAAQAAHQAALTQIAELRTDLGTACANLTRIETLCGVRGIDPASAVPVIPAGNSTPDPVAEYRAACEAKDWKRATEIFSANKAAIWASRIVS